MESYPQYAQMRTGVTKRAFVEKSIRMTIGSAIIRITFDHVISLTHLVFQ
jgi:hypothetical protein